MIPRRPRAAAVLVFLLLLPALASCDGSDSAQSASSSADGATIQEFAPTDRKRVDDFEGTLLDGQAIDATALDDTVTVVNVWGSWCGPCRVEAPALREVATAYADRGVRFLGLNVRDNDGAALAFERKFQIPYSSVRSADSPKVSLAFAGQITTAAVPMTVVVDRQRRVAARAVGVVSAATLRALLDAVLAEKGATP